MPSRELRPKRRLGRSHPHRFKIAVWTMAVAICGGGLYAAWRYAGTTEVEVAVARVRKADFVISVRARGDIKSARSTILKAPQVPGLRIVQLADNGSFVKKGETVVEFDAVQAQENVIALSTNVRSADGDIEQLKATQVMDDEADAMNKMTAEYGLESSKLDASKAEVLSQIDGEKNRIQVGVSEGSLQQVKATMNAHQVGHEADLNRLNQRKDKAKRDLQLAQGLPGHDAAAGAQRRDGDAASEFSLAGHIRAIHAAVQGRRQRVDRGGNRGNPGPFAAVRRTSPWRKWTAASWSWARPCGCVVDAIPDRDFNATIDWISPIADLVWSGGATPEKTFPAHATLKNLDDRLRPGHERSGGNHHRARPRPAADPDARQRFEERQAGGLRADRQGFRGPPDSGGPAQRRRHHR